MGLKKWYKGTHVSYLHALSIYSRAVRIEPGASHVVVCQDDSVAVPSSSCFGKV